MSRFHSPRAVAAWKAVQSAEPQGLTGAELYAKAQGTTSDKAMCAALQAMRLAGYLRFVGTPRDGRWFLGAYVPAAVDAPPTAPRRPPEPRRSPAQPAAPLGVPQGVPSSVWHLGRLAAEGGPACA